MLILGSEGKATLCVSTLVNVALRLEALNGVVANYKGRPVDRGWDRRQKVAVRMSNSGTHNHLVNKNTQSPPVHSRGVPCAVDNLRGNVFYKSRGCQSGFPSSL